MKNQIAQKIKERDENFVIPKIEHIFQTWKWMSQRNIYVLKKLASGMTKHYMKLGFNGIRDANNNKFRENIAFKHLSKFFAHYEKTKYQDAFNLWKEGMRW